ncbi:MAG: PAS domain S-box protein [FCB group bacterium]|nr:PAS domain S-box protein [FCB group bacterium]
MHTDFGMKSGWLIPLRLITFCLICGVILGWLGHPNYLQGPFLSYSFITLASFLTLFFLPRFKTYYLSHFLLAMQIITEIICEAGIIYSTGTLNSPFAGLFLLTIVSAALIYRLVGTLLVASVVSLSYGGIVWANSYISVVGNRLPYSEGNKFLPADDILFYSLFLHILIFYLVAFIAGYLAQKLQSKDRELLSASVELKKARLETGDILLHLNSGLLTLNSRGRVVFFNRFAENILGLKEAEVSGRHCRDVFKNRLEPLADYLLSVLGSRKRLSRAEFEILNCRGKAVPVGMSTSVLLDEIGDVRGLIAIFQDITEAKEMEERIRYADRMAAIGELSACIAHEIRNPLTSISGSVEVLKDDLVLEGDNDKLMSLIIKESARLNKILSDFLLYARVGRTHFQKIEVNRIISDVIRIFNQHPSFSDNIKIELLCDTHITYISGDEDQFKQLLLNLAVNACEALGPTGGVVQFEVVPGFDENRNETVCLIVRDDGPGIAEENIDSIFMPFHSTKKSGTGLGLAIVSRLMEAHKGRVEVKSELGRGTEFRLHFRGLETKTTDDLSASRKPVPFSN